MEITILNRTTKSEGAISLRFRLRDGRACDLTHKSGIKADLSDLAKLDNTGKPSKGVRIYNRDLTAAIEAVTNTMRTAYGLMCEDEAPKNNTTFARYIERVQTGSNTKREDIESRFAEYIRAGVRDGIIGEGRQKMYKYAQVLLHRFLVIECAEGIKPKLFDAEKVLRLRAFIQNEYQYTEKHAELYAGEKPRSIPTEARNQNTTATKLKMFAAFFNDLEERGEIDRSPFAGIGKEKRRKVLRERYNKPVYLTGAELQTIRTAQVPADLEETRTAFVLQCAIGCRLGDFQRLTMHNVGVTQNGVPYLHYLPEKTTSNAATLEEIETPLIRYAFDIIKAHGFSFGVTKYAFGERGYNAKIKKLLKHCGIDKECTIFNEETGQNEYVPLYTIGSSKLARKTAVDILNKVQIDMYAAGLHKRGSDAVNSYTEITIENRFALMCAAYGESPYKVDKNLQVL